MKLIKMQSCVCTGIQSIGTTAHIVHFHEALEDAQRAHNKPVWSFIVPGLKIQFEIGKQYAIQVCDPHEAEELKS